ncbi:MAG: FAD-dependent oxidoreductase [Gammaproteobacteria bacterium]
MRIAIIGGGVAGLYSAHLLQKQHDIRLFEAASYPGGHTNTVDAVVEGKTVSVDTGFIVHNDRNYPLFIALLDELGVAAQDGEMSFSMSCELTGLEYSGSSLNTLFAQRSNLFNPRFLGMLRAILRFNRHSEALLAAPADQTLADFLNEHQFGGALVEDYLVPMAAAIWSSDPANILDFPAAYFGRFFHNHGLLTVNDRPQWRTICGGSRSYVEPLIAPFKDRVHLNSPVEIVSREKDHVSVKVRGGEAQHFDQVIFACHSDQALQILSDPTPAEREVLGGIPYQPNDTVLHTDASLLPEKRLAWSAWNYHRYNSAATEVCVTYHMSLLQKLDTPKPLLVSLNATDRINPDMVLERIRYHHPVYDSASVKARDRWAEISGVNNTHYCGAYWGYGFHEDGMRSGRAVADNIISSRATAH